MPVSGDHANELSELSESSKPLARSLTGNEADAEDLVQNGFVRALGTVGGLRDFAKIGAWFRTIVRNLFRDKTRRDKSRPVQHLDSFVDESELAAIADTDSVEIADRRLDVKAAIEQLSDPQRRLIELRHFENLQFGAIATAMNLRREEVNRLHIKALLELKKILIEYDPARDRK